jgi:hemerythrin-like domain-containing protein
MKDPLDELMDEHRTIEQVLAALEAAAERELPVAFYERAVDFIVHFADGCHHDKEEALLFPAMEAHGVPTGGGPLGVMLHEHEVGRACVARMRQAIAAGDAAAARDAARDYTDLLRAHIAKEDGVLYRIARQVLPAAELASLAERFEAVEASRPDAPRYRELAARLLADAS